MWILLGVLFAAAVVWQVGWCVERVRNRVGLTGNWIEDVLKTLVPILAGILALFAYASSESDAESRQKFFDEVIQSNNETLALHQSHVNAQIKQLDLRVQQIQASLYFQAWLDGDWDITLERIDGQHFTPRDLNVEALLQRSAAEGPVTYTVPVLEHTFHTRTDRTPFNITIPAYKILCSDDPDPCAGAELERAYLLFQFEGEDYRLRIRQPEAQGNLR